MDTTFKHLEETFQQLKEINRDDISSVSSLCDELISQLSNLKYESAFQDKKKDLLFKNRIIKLSNTTMLYKPAPHVDMLLSNHLECFSAEREEELRRVDLLDIHNRFWQVNSVESGNIYASLPLQLVPVNAEKILAIYGWKRAEVIIYQVIKELSFRQIDDLCQTLFPNYLLTKAKEEQYIVLEYLLPKQEVIEREETFFDQSTLDYEL